MNYQFRVQRIGPVKLVLGGIVIGGVILGAVLFASALAIVGLIAGAVVTIGGLIAYGVQRFLRPKVDDSVERRAEGIVLIERDDTYAARAIEVEVIDDGEELPGRFPR